MNTCSRLASELLAFPWFTLIAGFSFTKAAISLVLLALVYQLVSRRALYTQTRPGHLLWWGGLVLLSWALLIYFAIEIKWVWRFFFG